MKAKYRATTTTKQQKKSTKIISEAKGPIDPDSEEEIGFSKWLHSDEGIENLKLFVLGNSLMIFLLISWPHIKEALDTVYYIYVEYRQAQ